MQSENSCSSAAEEQAVGRSGSFVILATPLLRQAWQTVPWPSTSLSPTLEGDGEGGALQTDLSESGSGYSRTAHTTEGAVRTSFPAPTQLCQRGMSCAQQLRSSDRGLRQGRRWLLPCSCLALTPGLERRSGWRPERETKAEAG